MLRRCACLILIVASLPLLGGCKTGSPGVRVSVGFMGAEVSVQIGGGELAPHAMATAVPDPTPPTPTEDPKDGEGVAPKPEGGADGPGS